MLPRRLVGPAGCGPALYACRASTFALVIAALDRRTDQARDMVLASIAPGASFQSRLWLSFIVACGVDLVLVANLARPGLRRAHTPNEPSQCPGLVIKLCAITCLAVLVRQASAPGALASSRHALRRCGARRMRTYTCATPGRLRLMVLFYLVHDVAQGASRQLDRRIAKEASKPRTSQSRE